MKKIMGLITVLVPMLALAQSYSIDWHKVAGGGSTSSGGQYSLSGTIGQPDASSAMVGGNFSVTGGFWAIYAVSTPGAPLLTITYLGNATVVSWSTSTAGWLLQTNNDLTTTNWGAYNGPIINNAVTNAPLRGNLFFRLKQTQD